MVAVAAAIFLCRSTSATEVDFWRVYQGPDEATYLLAPFDDESLPAGTADISAVQKIGVPDLGPGKFGKALTLGGRDGLRFTTAGIYPGGDLAIEAWVRLDEYPAELGYIVYRPAAVDQDVRYDRQRDTTKGFSLAVDREGALHLETTNCFYGAVVRTSSPAGTVPVGRWVHVAATSNGFPNSYRRLFVDGHEVASAAVTWGQGLMVQDDEETKPADILVGNDATGDKGLQGQIDQLRIHRRIVRFWPNEDEPWTLSNAPEKISQGPPFFLPRHVPAIYLPLDGSWTARGDRATGLEIAGGEHYEAGVCAKAIVGPLELRGSDLLDLHEGTLECWVRPVGVNSYSDGNCSFVSGPFVFYIFNSAGLANKPLALYFSKDDGDLLMLRAEDTVLRPGRWYHFAFTWRDDEITVYVDGQRRAKSFGVPLATRQNHGTCGQLLLGAGESLLDEVRLYRQALEPEEVANAYYRYRDPTQLVAAVDRSLRLRAQYLPSQNKLYYRVAVNDARTQFAHIELALRDATGTVLAQSKHPLTTEEQSLALPDLPDGRYELAAAAIGTDGQSRPGEVFAFRRQHFPWEGNQLGITDQVYPPFEPIRVADHALNVVGRTYTLGTLGFPAQITSNGADILAAPIRLRYETAAGEPVWDNASGGFTETRPSCAIFDSRAEGPAVQVRSHCRVEIDGCMKFELDLAPGREPAEIQRMWLEVPLRADATPLLHAVTAGLRENFAGALPNGTGVVWDGSQAHQYQRWLNAFVPYIWLGSPQRGLAWFAENDRDWITWKTPEGRLQEIAREQDRVVLRIYFINQSTTIGREHHLVFGLQAAPTKPMPADWRARVPDAPGGLPDVPWGGLACASQAPVRDDWRIVDKILEPRQGQPFDATWFAQYVQAHHPPDVHGTWPWLDAVTYFASRARDVGSAKPLAVYQEEMRGCDARPEWFVFQDEWTAEPTRYDRSVVPDEVYTQGYMSLGQPQLITFPRSYQDFGCWIADQWLRRGVSLYWDNTYPYASTNTRTTAAYVADDGRVQPCMIIWNQREYTKRVWHLLQEWRRQRQEPLEFTLHMTNTLLLPVHTWGTVDLDHELGSTQPFSPAWLLTETVGRQVGNLPLSLYAVAGSDNAMVKSLPAAQQERIEWGLRAVHEIQRNGPLEKHLLGFGYGGPEVRVHNYWDDAPVLTVTPDDVKWLVLEQSRSGDLLIVLASWSASEVAAHVQLDTARLTIGDARVDAVDAVDAGARVVSRSAASFDVTIPGPWGNRVLCVTRGGKQLE